MSTSELRDDLIKNISSIDDDLLLKRIKHFMEISDLNKEIHVFTDEQRAEVINSLDQYYAGNFMSSEEAEEDIKKWIEE